MKKNDLLDQIIKDKLNQLRVDFDATAWDAFEQKLDAEEAGVPQTEDRWMDEVVFEKLHKMGAGDRASKWELLAARLDEDSRVRRHLLRTRLMGTALIFLILFTFVQYFGQQTPVRLFREGIATLIPSLKERSENITEISKQQPLASNNITNNVNSSNSKESTLLNATLANRNADDSAELNKKSPSKLGLSPSLPAMAAKAQLKEPAISIDNPAQPQPFEEIPAPAERENLLAEIDRIMLAELAANGGEESYPRLLNPIRSKGGVFVSMFGSADYNHILTPSALDEAGNVVDKSFERYELGYSGGLMVSWEKNRWEIGTGAIYTAKEYEPRPLVYLGGSLSGGYYGESFKLVELDMLQLPLQVRYNFIKKNKWRAFVTSGLSLQVALQANYYLEEEKFPSAQRPPKPSPDGGFVTQGDAKKKVLSKGWFEGGSLLDNGYITGNVGFGLEYFITERLGLFTQPTYHHSLDYFTKGFGPDQDRINTMSIFTGVRVKL
ncbi:MAG: outer membrane beta-barrel protein [Saprospiraceae bacterium]|nr:outer membrane beta-barrel protein [Saprospiraceae bacterium]